MFPFLFTLLPVLVHLSSQKTYFCNLPCKKGTHTVCKYDPCPPHSNCGEVYRMIQLNDEERNLMVQLHNHYRHNVASGNDTRGGNGEASNMNVLSYSKELEFVAQCWANRCRQEGAHDQCRSIKDFNSVGQNVYQRTSRLDPVQEDLRRAVQGWYEEIKDTTADVIKEFKPTSGPAIGHFTQLVWAKTQYVGCGRTLHGSKDKKNVLVVCNYATGGNFITNPVYNFGKKCSDCGGSTCTAPFDSLCGKPRPLEDDNWKQPIALESSTRQASFEVVVLLLIVGILLK